VQRLSRYALVIHSYHMSKQTESSFIEYVIHAMLSSSDSNLFICYSVLPGDTQDAPLPSVTDGQRSAFSLVLLLEAIPLHCTHRKKFSQMTEQKKSNKWLRVNKCYQSYRALEIYIYAQVNTLNTTFKLS